MKIEYRRGDDSLHYQSFRKSIFECPHCDYRERYDDKTVPDWWSESQVRAVVFIDSGAWWKKGCCMLISECPKCFRNSFHHRELKYLLWDDYFDHEKLQAEIDRLVEEATKEWEQSLCFRCAVPKKDTGDEFGKHIDCGGRLGPPSQPDEEEPFLCKSFVQGEDKQ